MTQLEEYYNKFNEEKRFDSRHGQVEYRVSMKYIRKYLEEAVSRRGGAADDAADRSQIRLLDIGARHRRLQCGACRGGL